MKFEIVVEESIARKEVEKLLDIKNMLPNKRKELENPSETIIEAISLGFVTMDSAGKMTQTFIEPIVDTEGKPVLSSLEYKPRLDPVTVGKETAKIKAGSNQSVLIMMYAVLATGQPEGILHKMQPSDKDIRDAICSLFL